MTLASGTRVKVKLTRERTPGTKPAGVGTATTNVAVDKTGAAAGFARITDGASGFVTKGYYPGQWVKTAGFTTTANNGWWRVISVAAGTLTVADVNDAMADEVADVSQSVQISMQSLRLIERNPEGAKETLQSEEVRSTRQIKDLRHGFNSVGGTLSGELSLKNFDDLIELAMAAAFAWEQPDTGATTLTAGTGSAGTGTFSRGSGSFITDGFRPGDIVQSSGFSTSENNGTWRVLTVAATLLTVYDPTDAITGEAGGGDERVQLIGERCDIGQTLAAFFVERSYEDIGIHERSSGVALNQMTVRVEPRRIVNIAFDLIGMSFERPSTSSEQNSAVNKATYGSSPFSAFEGQLFEGASLVAVVTSFNVQVANNRSLEGVVGSKYSPDVFEGDSVVTGEMVSFVQDEVLMAKFYDEEESSLWCKLDDIDGSNFVNFVLPRIKYTGKGTNPPQRGPVPNSMPFQALETDANSTSGGTIETCFSIQRSNLRSEDS